VKLLVQRVSGARVAVDGRTTAEIGTGMLVFVGVEKGDTVDQAGLLAKKLAGFRIFEDGNGKMNLSLREVKGEALVVSEFTLAADVRKGTRPSFDTAEAPERARDLIAQFIEFLRGFELPVKEGVFGTEMAVSLVNDGPVTFLIESRASS
jgi:D-tyrosyl-tRNA(Tyr) deacylase